MPAVAYNLVFSFSGRDLSACWFWFRARVFAIAANAKRCLSSCTVDLPLRVTLTSTCSALVHFVLSGHGSRPRLALFLPPLHSCPAHSSFSVLPNSPPPRSLLWSLTSYLSGSPAAKALMRFLFGGRSNEGHALFCWPAACQVCDGALSRRKTDFSTQATVR